MSFLKKALAWALANKTKVGAALSAIGRAVSYFGYPQIGDPIKDLGDAITAIGLTHTAVKMYNGDDHSTDAPAPKAPEIRQITASADIFKPGISLTASDGKKLIIKRLVRGGTDGFVYDAEVKD